MLKSSGLKLPGTNKQNGRPFAKLMTCLGSPFNLGILIVSVSWCWESLLHDSTRFSAGWQKIRNQRSSSRFFTIEWRWPSRKSRRQWQWTPATWETKRKMMKWTGMPRLGRKVICSGPSDWSSQRSPVLYCMLFMASRFQQAFWAGPLEESYHCGYAILSSGQDKALPPRKVFLL